jgi:glycosyltransferase involved in cell wall biosynthesis
MSHSLPLVTVIAVCYNHEKFVLECLRAIEQQSYSHIQLIIIDDVSKDRSVSLITEWVAQTKLNAFFIQHSENKGICKNLNEGLQHAKGKYIAITATDDVWLPHKIESQVHLLEQSSEKVGVVYSDAYRIDEDGKLLPKHFIEQYRTNFIPPQGNIFPLLMRGNFIPAMSTLVRRSCYDKVGFYDEDLCYEDYDMWLRLSSQFDFVYSPEIATKYRIVSTSLSHQFLNKGLIQSKMADIQIYRKWLKSGQLDKELKSLAEENIYQIAEIVRKKRSPQRIKAVLLALRYKFDLRMLVFLFIYFLHLPPSLEEKLMQTLKNSIK